MLEALGLIEVNGYLGAISAADAALKAANVKLLKSEKIKGGISTVELVGDVAAITAAVDAGKVVAETLGCLRASHVIARMDNAVQSLLLEEHPLPEATKDLPIETTKAQLTSQVEELKVEIKDEIVAETNLTKSPEETKKNKNSKVKKSSKKDKK
ncbi:BMC domain-containing protein [Enterococcus rotai]|uniref:BMC domain-containing protein n=1 Tax=Enterococcus rotai TaxID=118060 RepID=UPI0035C66856